MACRATRPDGDPAAALRLRRAEAGFVKELRRRLRLEHGVPRERLSLSGYWRFGQDDDAWRAVKREWNAQAEAEQERVD